MANILQMAKGLVKALVLTNHQIATNHVAPTLKAELGQFLGRFRLSQSQVAVVRRGHEMRESLAEGGLEAKGR